MVKSIDPFAWQCGQVGVVLRSIRPFDPSRTMQLAVRRIATRGRLRLASGLCIRAFRSPGGQAVLNVGTYGRILDLQLTTRLRSCISVDEASIPPVRTRNPAKHAGFR